MQTSAPQGALYLYDLRQLSGEITLENPWQRVINRDKVKVIVAALLEEKIRCKSENIIQTGVIHVGRFEGKTYILDGQHRFEAYRELSEPHLVNVQLWTFITFEEMRKKFVEINSNTPVEGFLLDVNVQQVQKDGYNLVIDYVQTTYKGYMSTSLDPHFPHINADQFRQIVRLIPQLKDCKSSDAVSKFEEFNQECLNFFKNHRRKPERDRYESSVNKGHKLFINRRIKELLHEKLTKGLN